MLAGIQLLALAFMPTNRTRLQLSHLQNNKILVDALQQSIGKSRAAVKETTLQQMYHLLLRQLRQQLTQMRVETLI
jgi:hypothetical protein